MFKTKILWLFFLVLLFSILPFPKYVRPVFAGNVLFQDNFNDGNADGWEVIGSLGWNVQNKEYGIYLNPGVSNTFPSNSLWNNDWDNYAFEVDLRGVSGTDKNLIFRFVDNSNFYSVHHTGGNIYFSKYIKGIDYIFAPSLYYPLENGSTYHFRIEVSGDHFRLFESNKLLFDVIDITEPKISKGKIGLRVGTGAVSPSEVWYDNVVVTSLSPTLLPNLTVEDIKQYSSPWGDDIYDWATSWSANPTISRWGCALTSASMVLKYFGHSRANPDILNEWLKLQIDGFTRNGLVNWLAISRYTQQNDSQTSPTLEYRRLTANNTTLISELEAKRPAILREPGHFIVAKSQTSDSFGINDPAYEDRTTLESYAGKFLALGSYGPTHTDLSYMMFVADPDISFKLLDSSGNPVKVQTFIEEPINELKGSEKSGEPLSILLFSTPPSGEYRLKITGPTGSYQLDSYLYDVDGNVISQKLDGYIFRNEKDTYLIRFNGNNKVKITYAEIYKALQKAFEEKFIYNKGIFTAIKAQIQASERLNSRNMIFPSKIIIQTLIKQVQNLTPKFINTEFSLSLQSDLKSLIF